MGDREESTVAEVEKAGFILEKPRQEGRSRISRRRNLSRAPRSLRHTQGDMLKGDIEQSLAQWEPSHCRSSSGTQQLSRPNEQNFMNIQMIH